MPHMPVTRSLLVFVLLFLIFALVMTGNQPTVAGSDLALLYAATGTRPGGNQQIAASRSKTSTPTPTPTNGLAQTTQTDPQVTETQLAPTLEPLTPTDANTPTDAPTEGMGGATSTAQIPTLTATPDGTGLPGLTATPDFTLTVTATLTVTLTATPNPALLEINLLAPAVPTSVLPPSGPTSVPSASDPHVNYSITSDSCAACHRPHTASGPQLRQAYPEEQLCFSCHASGGTGTNIQTSFTSYTNTNASGGASAPFTRFFEHDLSLTNGVHAADESNGANFGGGSLHVECEDCHDPHDATRGSASPPLIQRVMTAVSGADPIWPNDTPGSPSGYNWLAQASREYQVCMKCHSSFTSLPTYRPDGWNGAAYTSNGLAKLDNSSGAQIADSRNLAQEFNPNNTSYHPVAAQGRNQSIPGASFVNGWSQSSLTYCSDCHKNANASTQGVGPHGSPRLHILNGSANYSTVDGRVPTSGEVCFNCHSYSVYVTASSTTATNFRTGSDNLHRLHSGAQTACYTCHDTHGSEQAYLLNFNASAMTFLNGRNSQTAWYPTAAGGGCYLACHNQEHNPKTYSR